MAPAGLRFSLVLNYLFVQANGLCFLDPDVRLVAHLMFALRAFLRLCLKLRDILAKSR